MLIYANEKKLMMYIFPERGKIDKAQLTLDRSGLVLKACKTPTASRTVNDLISAPPKSKIFEISAPPKN